MLIQIVPCMVWNNVALSPAAPASKTASCPPGVRASRHGTSSVASPGPSASYGWPGSSFLVTDEMMDLASGNITVDNYHV